MKIEILKKVNENYVALAVTFVLFVLLIVLKVQENQDSSIQSIVSGTQIELASTSVL